MTDLERAAERYLRGPREDLQLVYDAYSLADFAADLLDPTPLTPELLDSLFPGVKDGDWDIWNVEAVDWGGSCDYFRVVLCGEDFVLEVASTDGVESPEWSEGYGLTIASLGELRRAAFVFGFEVKLSEAKEI